MDQSIPVWVGLLDHNGCEISEETGYRRSKLVPDKVAFTIPKVAFTASMFAFYDQPSGGNMLQPFNTLMFPLPLAVSQNITPECGEVAFLGKWFHFNDPANAL